MRQIVLNVLLPKRHQTLKGDMFIFAMPHCMTQKLWLALCLKQKRRLSRDDAGRSDCNFAREI